MRLRRATVAELAVHSGVKQATVKSFLHDHPMLVAGSNERSARNGERSRGRPATVWQLKPEQEAALSEELRRVMAVSDVFEAERDESEAAARRSVKSILAELQHLEEDGGLGDPAALEREGRLEQKLKITQVAISDLIGSGRDLEIEAAALNDARSRMLRLSPAAARQNIRKRSTTTPKPLDDMFHDMLKDVYYAEKQILKVLPKMARAAHSLELRKAFETHRAEKEGHVERLGCVFEAIGKAPRGKTCDAFLGILEEGNFIMKEYANSPALDAGLVAAAQAVEHYEMTRYGMLRAWAQALGHADAASLLGANFDESFRTGELLTKISDSTGQAAIGKARAA